MKEVESTAHEVIKFNPCIVVFTGPGLTGKTSLGSLLAERTNVESLTEVLLYLRPFQKTQ